MSLIIIYQVDRIKTGLLLKHHINCRSFSGHRLLTPSLNSYLKKFVSLWVLKICSIKIYNIIVKSTLNSHLNDDIPRGGKNNKIEKVGFIENFYMEYELKNQ